MDQIQNSRIMTGDWVGSGWGASPLWSPYAQAIADHYPIQVPWFQTKEIALNQTTQPRRTQTTRPYLYDVLIFGAAAIVNDPGGESNLYHWLYTYLNVTHEESGIPWVTPNKIGSVPLPAIAGIGVFSAAPSIPLIYPTPILKLPEAFFLPANTQLKLDWEMIGDSGGDVTGSITFVGVQLINHQTGFKRPETVTMPNGQEIRVGSRVPWFSTVPVGEYQSRTIGDFELGAGDQIAQYFPSQECDVEICDAYSNWRAEAATIVRQTQTKLTDMGQQKFWTPNPTPFTAVYGAYDEVNPAMPFTKPYLLAEGHRIKATAQNNFTVGAIESQTITLRGVRRCQF